MGTQGITFLPEAKEAEVENPPPMDVAEKVGANINNLCGGKDLCGRCRVQVADAKVKAFLRYLCRSKSPHCIAFFRNITF